MKSFLLKLFFLFSCILQPPLSEGQTWRNLGTGTDGRIDNMYLDSTDNLLYVVGGFQNAGGQIANQIATWDSIQWNVFGSNDVFKHPGSLLAITKYNGDIIVGGLFDSIGNQAITNIARWNGSNWVSLGEGLDGTVYTLAEYNGNLYAGGSFMFSGTIQVSNLAKWDGASWSMVGGGFDDAVITLNVFHNSLVIGGSFSQAGSVYVQSLAVWNDTIISPIGAAFRSSIFRIRSIDDTLYVTGDFISWSGNPSNYISKWDGTTWLPMPYPTGGQHSVVDITSFDSSLYVCGYFSTPPDLAVLNGNQYDSVADAYGFIKTLQVYKNELYAAGLYSSINGLAFNNIARLNNSHGVGIEHGMDAPTLSIFPNPTSVNSIHLHISDHENSKIEKAELFSSDGKWVTSFGIENDLHLSALNKNISPGIYFLQIIFSKKAYVFKLILQR